MNPYVKKTFVFMVLLSIKTQGGYGQTLHDSLVNLTKYFYENTTDDHLKKTLADIQASYKSDRMDDSLAAKLVQAEDVMVAPSNPDQKVVFSFAEMLERLLRHLPPQGENAYYAGSLNDLARMYVKKELYAMALPLYQHALAIKKKVLGEAHPEYATILDNISVLYQNTHEYEKALAFSGQAMAIRKKVLGEESLEYAYSLHNLSYIYLGMQQYPKAIDALEQSLAIKKKIAGEESHDYAVSLYGLAKLYNTMGDYEKALPIFLQNVVIGKKVWGENHYLFARVVNSLGMLYENMGMYDKALPFVQQAYEIRKKLLGVEHPDYINSLEQMADIYVHTGQFQKAMPLFQETLVVRKKILGEEHAAYANSLNNLAAMYEHLGDYDKTLALTKQALAIAKKIYGEENATYIGFLGNVAAVYTNTGDYEKALPLQNDVLRLAKKVLGEAHPMYAYNLQAMAQLYIVMDNCNKALPLLEEAVSRTKKVQEEENLDQASILESIADVYKCMKQYHKALPLYDQALSIYKKVSGERNPNYVRCLNALGLVYALTGNTKDGFSLVKQACTIELDYLADTYAVLTEQEKMKLLTKASYLFSFLPSLMVMHTMSSPGLIRQLYTNELAWKGIVLEDQAQVLREVRKSSDSSIVLLYEQWRTNKNLLGKQLLQSAIEGKMPQDSIGEVVNHLEQQLSRQSAAFRNVLQRVTQKAIAGKLLKGEAAVEFFHFQWYDEKWRDSVLYAALVVLPGDSNVHLVRLFEEKQLQALLRPALKKTNSFSLLQKLYPGKTKGVMRQDSLYLLVWKPLEKYLKGIQTVYYAPAGLMHRISFNALKADAGHLLIEKYRLNQLLSTRSVAMPAPINPKPLSAVLWGNIQYGLPTGDATASHGNDPDGQHADTTAASFNFYTSGSRGSRGGAWHTLPGTAKELENIRMVLQHSAVQTTIDSGAVATEEAFKLLDGRSPKVLHLATHGFFLPVPAATAKGNLDPVSGDNAFTTQQNPMFRSGLVLAGGNHAWQGAAAIPGREDGILTAYEIAQMDLSNTDLVVLSACETALGDIQGNEGVIGLQRAFKMAGVKQMMVSLWRIPDKETTELMTSFYSTWLQGKPPREALRAAQLKMKEKYPPYYWASFVLVE